MDVMLDLETMGTRSNAAIVSIGACAVDVLRGTVLTPMWYGNVDLASSIKLGFEVDGDTIMWWMRQDEKARSKLGEEPVHIEKALISFSTWVRSWGPDVRMWGNGSDFDNVILGNAYHRLGLERPWSYRNNRCFRTITNLAKGMGIPKPDRVGVHHNALDDAIYQAHGLILFAQRVEIR